MPSHRIRAKAGASCSRCHKRKKRCDRALPSCKSCDSAQVKCSFLDNDHGQTATYTVAYVRSLEKRIHDLEKGIVAESSIIQDQSDECRHISAPFGDDHISLDAHPRNVGMSDPEFNNLETDVNDDTVGLHQEPPQINAPLLYQAPSSSLAEELKTISFEATAERHLGSSSGIAFAKLTQTVLRRLTPNMTDFVFTDAHATYNEPRLFDAGSPLDLFDPSLLESINESISLLPMLFGDVTPLDRAESSDTITALHLPGDQAHINDLVDFYFAHSHTLYPIIHRGELLQNLQQIQENPQDPVASSPLSLFRIWMVLAIGSTAYSSVSLTEESESRTYYNNALEYLDQAMASSEMAALEAIMLQVSYSFFNQLGPNTWFLVGLAARISLGMGLHTSSTYTNMSATMEQRRKRLFFSIYMMDRVVSIALGRPFALHDDDIDITPFQDINDDCVEDDAGAGSTQSPFRPSLIAIPLHILALRKIAGKIARQIYSNRQAADLSTEDREKVLHSLHKELIDWRRNMPFPIPDVNNRVPQLTSTWFDFNYYTHLAMIYRPSPLLPTMDSKRIKTLHEAASMSLRQAFSMHQQRRFAYNWLNFLSLFTSTLSLVYSTTVQPKDLVAVLKETRAIDDLDLAIELFDTLGVKFPAANTIRGMIAEVSKRYKYLLEATG